MGKLQKKQAGFSAVELILTLVVIVGVGAAGFFVFSSNKKDSNVATTNNIAVKKESTLGKKTPSQKVTTSYDAEKTKYIKDFDLASTSFKSALVDSFFDEAKTSCLEEAKAAPDVTDTNTYIVFKKMVRDDFALAQYCGSGGTSIFAKVTSVWKRVGSLAMAPSCELVDQYKISKDITPSCYADNHGTTKVVTYP